MTQEIEKLKTQLIAADAEIRRLKVGFDDLKKTCFNLKTDLIRENHAEYDKGWRDCATSIWHEINRITGE